MARKPFITLKRPNSPFYYVQFTDPNGRPGKRISSGETNRAKAEKWAIAKIQSGDILVAGRAPTLKQYSEGFFDFDGRWATHKKMRDQRLTPRHCNERIDLLNNHILPAIGNHLIPDISKKVINEFSAGLYKRGYSGSTINHLLSVLKAILSQAEDDEIIQSVPKIERAASKPKRDRGILTHEETQRLFSRDFKWKDLRAEVASRLSATTGMRLGEIQALRMEDLHLDEPSERKYLICHRSYDQHTHQLNKTTKTGRSRRIELIEPTADSIKVLLSKNPYLKEENPFIFWGNAGSDRPVYQPLITEGLYDALYQIGITEAQRRERNITFHSFRHYLSSLLVNARTPIAKVQAITGHRTEEMTYETYYHADDMQDVRNVINQAFTTH